MTSPTFFSSPPVVNSHTPHHRLLPPRLSSPCACSFHTYPIRITPTRRLSLPSIKSATVVDDTATTSSASASLFSEPTGDEAAAAKVGARVRVKVPLKVYHVPKVPEVELEGMEGVLKQYVAVWKASVVVIASLIEEIAWICDTYAPLHWISESLRHEADQTVLSLRSGGGGGN